MSLKDNLPHNTCQIYVKAHLKNTQMTLECQIFDEKALEKPVSFLDFGRQNVLMEAAIELPALRLKYVTF